MARTVAAYPSMQVARPAVRRKKSGSLLLNVTIGVGLVSALLVGASMVTMATAVKSASNVRFQTAIITQPVGFAHAKLASDASRDLDVSKFSRLPGSEDARSKGGRLAGANVSAIEAARPDAASVSEALHAAMAGAATKERSSEQFASLAKIRPDEAAIRAALGPAMSNLVVVAPKADGAALPDIAQEAVATTKVADLKDMKPVEMAAIDQSSDDEDDSDALAEIADAPIPTPAPAQLAEAAPTYDLPKAGPLPTFRPGAVAMADAAPTKPGRGNGLAAIAAVAPQKADSDDDKPTALAFARPDNPMRDDAPRAAAPSAPNWPGIGTKVAVFDISNGVVWMPDGTKLEAHSGIGKMRDDPDYTHVKMRGPTPPGTYRLTMRESLFHGVAAIRLNPIDGKAPQGRTGLLAHSYLVRSRLGDSHGCVAFANYDKFLAAFRRGEVTHMVIVPKYDGRRPVQKNNNFLAKLFGGKDA